MKLLMSWLFVCLLATSMAYAQSGERGSEVTRYVWDLSSYYPNDAAWEAERGAVQQKLTTINRLKGTLGRNARSLADGLDAISDLRRRAHKLSVYGILTSAVDTKAEKARRQHDVGTLFETQVEAAISFVADEIRAIGAKRLAAWVRAEPRLAAHQRQINQALREAPHTLPAQAQTILRNLSGRWSQLTGDSYEAWLEADLGWPVIRGSDGKETTIDPGAYAALQRSPEQSVRLAAAKAYLGRLRAFERGFGLLLTRRIEADATAAQARNFSGGLEALFFLRDGMPRGSQHLMSEVARANLPTFQRYLRLRQRALGLARLTYADLRVPPPWPRRFTVPESMEIAITAAAPLGVEYQTHLRDRLAKPWMHLPPLPEKQTLYGIFPPVGGAAPYTIMSYGGSYTNSRALVGAAFLMMCFADIPTDRMPDNRYDPGIYTNALLNAGYILHDDYLKARAVERQERIAILLHALDRIRGQFFDWTLAAEFEAAVEQLVRDGQPPSGSELSRMYLARLRQYFGHNEGVAEIDEVFGAAWITNDVSFAGSEHLLWPPSMAAACWLVERLRAGDDKARRGFHQVLGRGELDLTYTLFRQVGLDLAAPTAYEALARRMNALLDELENALNA